MTWRVVARRDLRVIHADNYLLFFGGFFALLAAAAAYGITRGVGGPSLASSLAMLFLFAVPLTAVTMTHEAVPGGVASGRVRLTLSLPHRRSMLLAGAGAARLALTLVSVLAAALLGSIVFVVRGGALALGEVVIVAALAVLLAAAFVAATLALTARSSSTTLAAATTYGFVLLSLFWPIVVNVAGVVFGGQFGVVVAQDTLNAVVLGSPMYAYGAALEFVGGNPVSVTGSYSPWLGVAVLAAWIAVGFALAVWRFDSVEL